MAVATAEAELQRAAKTLERLEATVNWGAFIGPGLVALDMVGWVDLVSSELRNPFISVNSVGPGQVQVVSL